MERGCFSQENLALLADELSWINSDLYQLKNKDHKKQDLNSSHFDNIKSREVNLTYGTKSEIFQCKEKDSEIKHYKIQNVLRRSSEQSCGRQLFSAYVNNDTEKSENAEVPKSKQFGKRRAFSLAGDFEPFPAYFHNVGETLKINPSSQHLEEKNVLVNLFIETKDSHFGPYLFELYSKMNVGLLKLKVENELLIPAFYQRWILNNTLITNNDLSLMDYGAVSRSSLFLYVDSGHDRKFDIRQLSGAQVRRNSTTDKKNLFELDSCCHNFSTNILQRSNVRSLCTDLSGNADGNSLLDDSLEIDKQNLLVTGEMEDKEHSALLGLKNKPGNEFCKKKNKLPHRRKMPKRKKDTKLKNTNLSGVHSSNPHNCIDNPGSSIALDCNNSKVVDADLEVISSLTSKVNDMLLQEVINCQNLQNLRQSFDDSFKNQIVLDKKREILPQRPRKSIIEQIRSRHKYFNSNYNSFEANDLTLNQNLSDNFHSRKVDDTESLPDGDKNNKSETYMKCNSTDMIQEFVKHDSMKNSSTEFCEESFNEPNSKICQKEDNILDDINLKCKVTETFQDIIEREQVEDTVKACEGETDKEQNPGVTKILQVAEIYIVKTQSSAATYDNDGSFNTIEALQEDPEQNELNQETVENYEFLLRMENSNLVRNVVNFTCPVCFGEFDSDQGVVLHECLHTFCFECLGRTVEYAEETLIKCPYRDDEYSCQSFLQQREIKALVSEDVYERYLQKSITTAESLADKSFHCKTPDCHGWCLFENSINIFHCPVCLHFNCLNCNVQHEGLNCRQYQDKLKSLVKSDPDSEKTLEFLNKMIDSGKAMKCPKCDLILMKKWGCDWLKCSVCLTEICWITKGPRWGPAGQGDTSAGCRCGVNGVKCHSSCTYCH